MQCKNMAGSDFGQHQRSETRATARQRAVRVYGSSTTHGELIQPFWPAPASCRCIVLPASRAHSNAAC
jgi:hypothetical protein